MLCGISTNFSVLPPLKGRLLTRYSPVRRYPLPNSAEASFGNFPLDLHVLGTPPAFVLSQDQTLNKIILMQISFALTFYLSLFSSLLNLA